MDLGCEWQQGNHKPMLRALEDFRTCFEVVGHEADVANRLDMIGRVEKKSELGQVACLLLLLTCVKVDLLEGIAVAWELYYFEDTVVVHREVDRFGGTAAEDQEGDHSEDIAVD